MFKSFIFNLLKLFHLFILVLVFFKNSLVLEYAIEGYLRNQLGVIILITFLPAPPTDEDVACHALHLLFSVLQVVLQVICLFL